MRYVLDTHILLWYANGDRRLKGSTLDLLQEDSAQLCVSAASLWELSIKESLGKLELEGGYSKWTEQNILRQPYEIMMIEIEHFNQLSSLPWHHRDPFDRLILSQCMMEKAHLVTHDKIFAEYSGVELLLV